MGSTKAKHVSAALAAGRERNAELSQSWCWDNGARLAEGFLTSGMFEKAVCLSDS